MSAIGSVASAAVYQAPPASPPTSQKVDSQKVDSDGDHDGSPPSDSGNASSRALNVIA